MIDVSWRNEPVLTFASSIQVLEGYEKCEMREQAARLVLEYTAATVLLDSKAFMSYFRCF